MGREDDWGKPFGRGNLYELLTNPLYMGEVRHHKRADPGQHQAIIDLQIWEATQKNLEENASDRKTNVNVAGPHLLTGLLFDENGEKLCPTYSSKKGRRYHNYISKSLMHDAANKNAGWRLPAQELETAVLKSLGDFLTNQERLCDALKLRDLSVTATASLIFAARTLVGRLNSGNDKKAETMVRSLVRCVTLSALSLSMTVPPVKVLEELGRRLPGIPDAETISFEMPIKIARRGVETRLIIRSDRETLRNRDLHFLEALSKAHRWMDELISGKVQSLTEIVEREEIDNSEVSRILPLAFLSPDVVDGIFDGKQAISLTAKELMRSTFNPNWQAQRQQISTG